MQTTRLSLDLCIAPVSIFASGETIFADGSRLDCSAIEQCDANIRTTWRKTRMPLKLRSFIRHPCADGGRDRRDDSRGDAARHTRPYRTTLTANRAAVAVFVLINGAAIVRVCATWRTAQMANLLLIAGALWIAAFLLFELIYGPMLLTRREGA